MKNFIFVFIMFAGLFLHAQNEASPVAIPDINRIEAKGNVIVYLKSGSNPSILVNLNGNEERNFKQTIDGNSLTIEGKGGSETIKIEICAPSLGYIKLNSIANLRCSDPLTLKDLTIETTGAIDADLDLTCNSLMINSSGASNIKVLGNGNFLDIIASGAADIDARSFIVTNAKVKADGAASTIVDVTDSLSVDASGAADVTYMNEPKGLNLSVSGAADAGPKGGKRVSGLDGIENNADDVDDVADIDDVEHPCDSTTCTKKGKYDGHWAGVDLMLTTFVDKSFGFEAPAGYKYLELEIPKSFGIQINFFEQNVTFIKKKLGMTTGLGLQFVNYGFDSKVRLTGDSASIFGRYDTSAVAKKSKLSALYLTLPLMFEYQSNAKSKKNSFHVGVGGFAGLRMASHTKVVIKNPEKDILKSRDDFHLNPFKYGLTARFGWSKLNFTVNYNLSTLFKKNQGPELMPFEFGITLVNL